MIGLAVVSVSFIWATVPKRVWTKYLPSANKRLKCWKRTQINLFIHTVVWLEMD